MVSEGLPIQEIIQGTTIEGLLRAILGVWTTAHVKSSCPRHFSCQLYFFVHAAPAPDGIKLSLQFWRR